MSPYKTYDSHLLKMERNPSKVPCGMSRSNIRQYMPSPVSRTVISQLLQGYDESKSEYLVNGFRSGFRTGCLSIPVHACLSVINLRSAFTLPQVVDAKIKKELALNHILSLYDVLLMYPHSDSRH